MSARLDRVVAQPDEQVGAADERVRAAALGRERGERVRQCSPVGSSASSCRLGVELREGARGGGVDAGELVERCEERAARRAARRG